MTDDVVCVEGPLKFTLEFAQVDPLNLGVQVRLQVEYVGEPKYQIDCRALVDRI